MVFEEEHWSMHFVINNIYKSCFDFKHVFVKNLFTRCVLDKWCAPFLG